MEQLVPKNINGNHFILSPERCLYWEEEKTLVLSDLHFGKTGHFRKAGIAIPQAVFKEDIQRFATLLQTYKPKKLIVIGDMFHSRDNKEHALFLKWRKDFDYLHIQLVMGNHDILHKDWYKEASIEVIVGQLHINQFSFVHDIEDADPGEWKENYFFSGHVHPCINIRGTSRQSICFPCFYFAKQFAILPAFGKFTGTYPIKPKKGESVYAVMAANHQRGEQAGIIQVF